MFLVAVLFAIDVHTVISQTNNGIEVRDILFANRKRPTPPPTVSAR